MYTIINSGQVPNLVVGSDVWRRFIIAVGESINEYNGQQLQTFVIPI